MPAQIFPVNTTHPLPRKGDLGAFGTVRRFDIHTGIDLYCKEDAAVSSIEEGVVVAVEKFTGEHAGSPWWNNTWAVLVEGPSGVICYGEIVPSVEVGQRVHMGGLLGHVTPVLKKDKGVTPVTMLHFELYEEGTRESVWWRLGEPCPENLKDPTSLLKKLLSANQKRY